MIKKKVLLIYPQATVYGSGIIRPILPMSLMFLAGFLRGKGVDVEIFDVLVEGYATQRRVKNGLRYGLSEAKIKAKIKKVNPDYVGISCMFTAYYDDVVEMAKLIKSVNKNIKTIIGGAHVSIDPKESVKPKWIDLAVFGEGEETLYEIVSGKKVEKIDGLVYKSGKEIIKNKPRALIKDLDTVPFPAWDLLNLKKYDRSGPFSMRTGEIIYQIISSRGCPGHCLYCSIHSVWNHSWRGRSAKNVVDEIEYLMKNFEAKEFSFQDDSMSVNRNRMMDICKEIIGRKLKIKWTTPNGIAHWTLDEEVIGLMKQAGCYRITFGIESGDVETRRWVGKPYSLDQAKRLIKFANSIGLWTLATNIIGFPYETDEQMERTLKYAVESGVDQAFFYILGPRPGTEMYTIFEKEGWLIKDKKRLFSEDVACDTKYFTGAELVKKQKDMYQYFFKKRWISIGSVGRILSKIRSVDDLKYMMRISWYGLKLMSNFANNTKVVSSKTLRV